MDTPNPRTLLQLSLLLLVITLAGCAQNAPYHTRSGAPGNCVTAPDSDSCRQSYFQEYEHFDLAFAEFSERGNAFSDAYLKDVKNRIAQKAADKGVVLVIFVHGWKHNAAETDSNLIDFKKSLGAINDALQARLKDSSLGERDLVGLYIGWRGASIELEYLKQITFWDRKAVAEEVGKGGVTRLLLELDEITDSDGKNVMVVIGHSFGGAIVTSALSEVLTERATNRTQRSGYAPNIGDGVLVINPAIEANQALNLVEATIQEDFRPEQNPLFVSLSTDADGATHYAFPAGQTIGLLATWRQAELQRGYYRDRRDLAKEIPLSEKHLDANTVGNFAPFLTHRLTAVEGNGQVKFEFETCDDNPEGCEPMGWTSLKGQPTVHPLPANYPLYFIKTDESLMTGHNDIFNERVNAFVVTVIDDVVSRTLSPRLRDEKAPGPRYRTSILNQPSRLEARVQEMLESAQ